MKAVDGMREDFKAATPTFCAVTESGCLPECGVDPSEYREASASDRKAKFCSFGTWKAGSMFRHY